MVNVLALENVQYVRDGRIILDALTWSVDSSERWVILGANGAGKTSLLTIAAGMEHPSAGLATVLGERLGRTDVFELRNRIGFASSAQAARIPANETVLDAVLTAAHAVEGRWLEEYESLDIRRAERVLAEWNLTDYRDQLFGTLSDGERKRVLIARAVMTDPEVLLLDEPAASLDVGAREQLLALLDGYASSPNSPAMIMVTHRVEEIPEGFTHLLLLKNGSVFAQGEISTVLTSQNLSEAFGVPLSVSKQDGRFTARMSN
jgi:iron complex transport system ATP-binding protein